MTTEKLFGLPPKEEIMTDINKVLSELATKRPVFHSEADFQHALALEIRERYPSALVRLERPAQPTRGKGSLHIDVWIANLKANLAIELKYRTRVKPRDKNKAGDPEPSIQINDEQYFLKYHSSCDTGRYDFIRDIQRLEEISAEYPNFTGYAILLTNESAYWEQPNGRRKGVPQDAQFRIHDGAEITGEMDWGPGTGDGTKNGRGPLSLRGSYHLKWEDYSEISEIEDGKKFRLLVVKVTQFG